MRWFFPISWAGLIIYLSLMPSDNLPDYDIFRLLFIDKWIHAFLYFVFAFLIFISFKDEDHFLIKAILVFIFCVSFGVGIEIMQDRYTESRHFEGLDIAFDVAGAITYVFIWLRRRSLDFLKKSGMR